MSSCLWFVHDGDEPSVDVDDDVALPDAALVRIRLLLNFAQHKVKTKLVAEMWIFYSLFADYGGFLSFFYDEGTLGSFMQGFHIHFPIRD